MTNNTFTARRQAQLAKEAEEKSREERNKRVLAEMKKQSSSPVTVSSQPPPSREMSHKEIMERVERLNRSVERITSLMQELRSQYSPTNEEEEGVR